MANKPLGLMGVGALCALPAAGQAQITVPPFLETPIINEDFNTDSGTNVTTVGPFTAVSGNVDVLHGSRCVPGTAANGCIELDGTAPATLESGPIKLEGGYPFFLSFHLTGSQLDNHATATEVSFGPFSHTYDLAANDLTSGLVSMVLSVPKDEITRLTFKSLTPGATGAILDDVLVARVPEPATLGLMVLGLFGAGFSGRKRTH